MPIRHRTRVSAVRTPPSGLLRTRRTGLPGLTNSPGVSSIRIQTSVRVRLAIVASCGCQPSPDIVSSVTRVGIAGSLGSCMLPAPA